jgi:caffeoyl-CoA O-methyltransferase
MNIIEPRIDEYIMNLNPERDEIRKEMEQYARQNHFPIIGPMAGRFLRQLALITGAEKIFEMGSGYGYSAYWFASGMPENGKIICTDTSEENRQRGMSYLKRGGYESKVEYYVGDALDIIREFDGRFDIILNDIDKEHYPETLELAIPRLRKGGIFITDNVLWSGRILHKQPDTDSRAILEFNRKLFASKDIFSSIIPIHDGVGMAVKLA